MKTVLRSLAVVIIFVLTSNVIVLAAPVNEKLQQQKDSLTRIQTEREQVETKIEEFDNEIEKIMIKTEENKRKISETEKSIEVAAVEVKKVARESQKEQGLFNSRMRVMYINGSDGYLSIILDSESFGDFISRVDNIKTVVEFDKKLMVRFEVAQKELSEKQKNLKNTKESLLSLQVENKQKIDKIMVTKESQSKLITQLKSKEIVAKELQNKLNAESKGTNISAQIIEPQVSVNKSLTKISELKKSVPTYTPSRGGATVSQGAIIAYASNFLGTPYLWGGTTPSGFDCSGFTQYVYAHFGISVGRTTFDQINDGVEVSRDKLQPGDLVFFGSFANPHHMGMYIGDNNYIHAPRTGDVIKISALGRNDYVTARRVK
ncbi:NlpC/P60 family protein [Clostridium estertheticum]|uniref:C40 family peptidase n=1 Tax=Clostridium estertheticum TaxID=238834 RepID=UPI001C0E8D44|nr:C40 family peptidase [Clostridium estertheticum]MBU3215361.1 C40 family peptidase [Clostridium estertheticum]MCB2308522.1 NlpC/P60 family protein [Clostridium estertheticum]MCB2346930.1 NlpC/P60 family protein [Clostridium estertheticum]MCB2351522.1 NlpC/P60 family protein [Clostridium estertheticum]WAG46604.1 NlpC/P60 family protein [Clostridium estertheticum]